MYRFITYTMEPNFPTLLLYRFGADGNLRLYGYDRLFFSLYGYDAGTTRTYKYSFDLSPNWVNGQQTSINFNLHNAMFYPNSYLNFNQDGHYTKHYYNGMERIASRLGDNNLLLATHDPELQDRKWQLDSNIRRNIVDITGYDFLPVGEEQNLEDPKPVFELPQVGLNNLTPNTSTVYYYHPNHLGSTCFVTDDNTSVVQGFLYAPFGEITNEHNSGWQNGVLPKYSFNAKELDEETGMYYYEARYYAPPTFVSRDPLFEKYPTFSPYAYCANNPVKFIDPTGEENLPALLWARKNMSNKGIPSTYSDPYFGGSDNRWSYKKGTVPSRTVCYESCFMAYMNSTDKVVSHLMQTGFATSSGGFRGRSNPKGGMSWFKNGDGTDRSFVTDITKGELGDIVFMGNPGEMQGHAVLLNGLPEFATDGNGNVDYNTIILNTLSTSSDSDPNNYGERKFTFEKQKDGSWKQKGGAEYVFRGYGQLNANFSKEKEEE